MVQCVAAKVLRKLSYNRLREVSNKYDIIEIKSLLENAKL